MFNLNAIDTCAIVLLFTINTYAQHNSNKGLFNVGTVLFTSEDLNRKRWSRTNIELLQARRYFQNIIPPPSMKILNDNYVDNLLKYFTNALTTVKREAVDPMIINVMEKALSDAIGGYLKVWVLPITKLTYYGGSVSQDDAVKVFEYYEKLKRTLNTDGSGWREPSNMMLNSIAITVVPLPHVSHARSMRHPCEQLAYYEKTDTGLTIPTPYINWNEAPYSMFLPLKNESLVQLDSPSSSKALMKYYDIAESCCQSKSPDTCNDFDLRFQDWLSKNVVAHINDDQLYIAFGSLLSLLNKTNELIEKSSNWCEYEEDKFTFNSLLSRLPPWMTSNKFLILIIILIIEIIWCIPALLYILCSRRRKSKMSKMRQRTQFFLDTFKRRRCHTVGRIIQSEETNNFGHKKEPINIVCHPRIIENGVRLTQRPRDRNTERNTHCPSQSSKHSTGQVTSDCTDINNERKCQCKSITSINENLTVEATSSPHDTTDHLPNCKIIKKAESFIKVQKFETTITKFTRDKSRSNSKFCIKESTSKKAIEKIAMQAKQKSKESCNNRDELKELCPCTNCFEHDRINMEAKTIPILKETKAVKISDNLPCTKKPRNVIDVTNRIKVPKLQPNDCTKNINLNKSKGLKLNSGEPLLEIRIDKPAAEITVDITKTCRKNPKPSKIPRLATCTNAGEEKTVNPCPRNVIPCVCETDKKRSMDDLCIKKKVTKHNKMNMTY